MRLIGGKGGDGNAQQGRSLISTIALLWPPYVIGSVCKHTITDMYIGSSTITWCNSIRYLGVNIESGSCFKVNS